MKQITLRRKSGKFWSTIYAKNLGGNIWAIGLVIHKSKRASNDWYAERRNKRRTHVIRDRSKKTLKELRVCFTLLKKALIVLPRDADLIIRNDFREAQALSKYVERLGFMPVYHRGFPFWVLTVPKKEEALHRF